MIRANCNLDDVTMRKLYKNGVKIILSMSVEYNHFALSFKELSIYELHMFRVTSAKLNILNLDIISITLNTDLYHSIHIVYDKEKSNR